MTSFPTGFSKWPGLVQRVWMKAHPGVMTRDHRNTTRVPSQRGNHKHLLGSNVRPHHHHGCDGVEPHRPTPWYGPSRHPGNPIDPGFTDPGYRPGGGRPLADNDFQRMLDSGNIEQLINSPGAGEWLKKPENNLKVMQAMQNESRRFTLLTNVMKMQFDATMAAVRNIRM